MRYEAPDGKTNSYRPGNEPRHSSLRISLLQGSTARPQRRCILQDGLTCFQFSAATQDDFIKFQTPVAHLFLLGNVQKLCFVLYSVCKSVISPLPYSNMSEASRFSILNSIQMFLSNLKLVGGKYNHVLKFLYR